MVELLAGVFTWVTVACALAGGVWLFKTAIGIKIRRRAARESGKDGIYISRNPADEHSDPLPVSYVNDPTFNPDDVELIIDTPSSGPAAGSQTLKT